jgi:mannose-6-phosphate isomerase-like protein (cupin superfamily)
MATYYHVANAALLIKLEIWNDGPMTTAARGGDTIPRIRDLTEVFGVRFFAPGSTAVAEARPTNLYHYRAFIGVHQIAVEAGDCVYYVGDDGRSAALRRGPTQIASRHLATVVRGYMPEDKTTTIHQGTTLPYVNGCSTKQLFAAERPGDPTLQLLYMPPHTTEQVHHIHPTARVVYIMAGRGIGVVGLGNNTLSLDLAPGSVCVLEPMCPHHFETGADPLYCVPLHIFSSSGRQELDHPMFQGTHLIDRQ